MKRSTEARNQSSAPSWLTGSTVKSSVDGDRKQVDDRVQVGSSSGTVGTPGGSISGGTFGTSRSMVPESSGDILGGSSFQNMLPLNSNSCNIAAISGSNATESGIIQLDHELNVLHTFRSGEESIHPSAKGTSVAGLQQPGSTSFTTDSSLLILQTQVAIKDGEHRYNFLPSFLPSFLFLLFLLLHLSFLYTVTSSSCPLEVDTSGFLLGLSMCTFERREKA